MLAFNMVGCEDYPVKNSKDSLHFGAHSISMSAFNASQGDSRNFPIGVFDSGLGGLTVLKELQRKLPQESFLYFGDTANVPYGGRDPEDLLRLTRQILDWMAQKPVKMAIMACNTSSAWTLEHVRHEYPFPILGIILPVAKAANTLGKRIGVIATKGTVDSGCYANAIQEVDAKISVFQMACPEFVPLIEQGKLDDWETHQAIASRLQPLVESKIDSLIYGCTHYPHLRTAIRQYLPKSIKLVDPALYIAKAAKQELQLLRLNAKGKRGFSEFYVSANPEGFSSQTQQLMNFTPQVQLVKWAYQTGLPLVS